MSMYQCVSPASRSFDETFPGRSCGNSECENRCREAFHVAQMSSDHPDAVVRELVESRIAPDLGCSLCFDDAGSGCRFGFSGGFADTLDEGKFRFRWIHAATLAKKLTLKGHRKGHEYTRRANELYQKKDAPGMEALIAVLEHEARKMNIL